MTRPALILALLAATASAQVVLAPAAPQIGSSNPVSAEPTVARPNTKPCTVQLLTNQSFIGFDQRAFVYTPPVACPGHGPRSSSPPISP